jgi:sugar lactone lactonase YvrE
MGPIIKVVDTGYTCLLGEAPHWSAVEQTLYYVDIYNCRVLRYDPSTGINSYVTVSFCKYCTKVLSLEKYKCYL